MQSFRRRVNSFFPALLDRCPTHKSLQSKYKNSYLLENIEGSHFTELTTSLNQRYISFFSDSLLEHSLSCYFNPQLQKRQYFLIDTPQCSNQTSFKVKFRLFSESCLCVNSWHKYSFVLIFDQAYTVICCFFHSDKEVIKPWMWCTIYPSGNSSSSAG